MALPWRELPPVIHGRHYALAILFTGQFGGLSECEIAAPHIEKILEFGMEDAFKKIENEMEFRGSFAELRSIIIAGHYGAWSDVGITKQFKYRKRDKTIIWWPDTGDILVRTTPEQFSNRLNDYRKRYIKPRLKNRWTVIPSGKLAGKTLPEAFFADPTDFLEDVYDIDGSPFQAEASEIAVKASAIAIPRKCPAKFCVVHQFGPGPNVDYRGFSVRRANPTIERYRGIEVLDSRIDISVPSSYLFGDMVESGLVSRCLMKELDKLGSRLWDREGCGDFFNDEAYFVN
jgi:hypothetical protein